MGWAQGCVACPHISDHQTRVEKYEAPQGQISQLQLQSPEFISRVSAIILYHPPFSSSLQASVTSTAIITALRNRRHASWKNTQSESLSQRIRIQMPLVCSDTITWKPTASDFPAATSDDFSRGDSQVIWNESFFSSSNVQPTQRASLSEVVAPFTDDRQFFQMDGTGNLHIQLNEPVSSSQVFDPNAAVLQVHRLSVVFPG